MSLKKLVNDASRKIDKDDSCNEITLEIWSWPWVLEKKKIAEEGSYVDSVLQMLHEEFPGLKVIYKEKQRVEQILHPEIEELYGFRIKLKYYGSLASLKQKCMELEKNESGSRQADIDVYHEGKKITKKSLGYFSSSRLFYTSQNSK